jgi:hypothetical protein
VLVALAFALAWLTYAWVELPIRGPQARLPATRAAPVVAGVIAAIGLLGIGTAVTRGFPARLPAILDDTEAGPASLKAYREDTCFVNAVTKPGRFADECLDPPGLAKEPLLILWGDSHAAHLYPGLHALQKTRQFRLAQYTSVACPPYLGLDIPNVPFSRETNRKILQDITQLQPDWVILSAAWAAHSSALPTAALDDTISALKGRRDQKHPGRRPRSELASGQPGQGALRQLPAKRHGAGANRL